MPDADSDRHLLRIALGAKESCIPLEELASWLDRSVSSSRSAAIEAHLRECEHCQTELSLLREFESAGPRPEEAAAVNWIVRKLQQRSPAVPGLRPAAGIRSRWREWLRMPPVGVLSFGAAALVVMIATGIYMRRAGEPALTPGTMPGVEVYRSHELEAVSPIGRVPEAPSRLVWKAIKDAGDYEVRLMEVDRTILWKAASAGADIEIPDSVRIKLTPGRVFLWEAVARDHAGNRIASTAVEQFQIGPGR